MKALINLIGIYPVGTCVILDTFEVGIVASVNPNPELLNRPVLRLCLDADGALIAPPGREVNLGEVDAYRKAGVARFFRADPQGAEGTDQEPWEPIPGHASQLRLRKRADGACGFLSPENRCRLHEELGPERKPRTCRLFPFRFHATGGPLLVTASFCCPTVVANQGALLATQAQGITALPHASVLMRQ